MESSGPGNPGSYVIIELRVQEFLESVEPKSFVTGVSKVAVTET